MRAAGTEESGGAPWWCLARKTRAAEDRAGKYRYIAVEEYERILRQGLDSLQSEALFRPAYTLTSNCRRVSFGPSSIGLDRDRPA
jgi:hypothetical protein